MLTRSYTNPNGGAPVTVAVEYLFLVNGQDDVPNEGFVDNHWNTSLNNGDAVTDFPFEAENEAWVGALANLPFLNTVPPSPKDQITAPYQVAGALNLNYTISRRPIPSAKGKEIQLPSDVVIDLTTALPLPNPPFTQWTQERSRIPMQFVLINGNRQAKNSPTINQDSGYVDILVYPDGSVATATQYSSPASVGLSGNFLHFWLAERADVVAPNPNLTGVPYLPVGNIQGSPQIAYRPRIKGEYRLVTVFMRNGQIATNDTVLFDNPLAPQNGVSYNASLPFLPAQQGVSGGQ
jgi:hypothetical protein